MLDKAKCTEYMNEIVEKIQDVMNIIHIFEDSRPGSLAFTRLEEAIMWMNVMVHNIPLRPQTAEIVDEKKEKNVIAE